MEYHPRIIINPSKEEEENIGRATPELKIWCEKSRASARAYLLVLEADVICSEEEENGESPCPRRYNRVVESPSLEELVGKTLALMYAGLVDLKKAVLMDCTNERPPYMDGDAVCRPFYHFKDVRLVRRYDFRKLKKARTREEMGFLKMATCSRAEEKAFMVEITGSSESGDLKSTVLSTEFEPNVAARLVCSLEGFEGKNLTIFDCRATRIWPEGQGRRREKLSSLQIKKYGFDEAASMPNFEISVSLMRGILNEFLKGRKVTVVYSLNVCGMWMKMFDALEALDDWLGLMCDICGTTLDPTEISYMVFDLGQNSALPPPTTSSPYFGLDFRQQHV